MPESRRFWPYKTVHGWIVGVAAIDTDDCPTFLTDENAAERWAERLNRGNTEEQRLRAEVERLKAQDYHVKTDATIRQLEGEVETLREALGFYSDGFAYVDTALRGIVNEARQQTPRLTGDRFALTVGLVVLERLNLYGGQ